MAGSFELAGANDGKNHKFRPLWTNRWFSGLVTQRNPLRSAGSFYEERYFGSRGDALIDGLNIEISNRLTPIRRPGNSVYNTQSFTAVDFFYDFHLFNANTEQIKVMVDTAAALFDGTGPSTKQLIWTKTAGAGQTFMQGVGNTLFFGNGIDQKKWVNTLNVWTANKIYTTPFSAQTMGTFIIDTNGNIQQLTNTIVPILTIQITSNVGTVTTGSATDLTTVISPDQEITFPSSLAASFLSGQTVTILTVTASTFTFNFAHANYGPTSESNKIAVVLQGGSPVSGAVQPVWATTLLAVTHDNTAQWTNRGSQVENWGIVAPTTAPLESVGTQTGGWVKNTWFSNWGVIVDSNGGLQQITTAGTSGASTPAWQAAGAGTGTTTSDGSVVWTKLQTAASLTWAAHTTYAAGAYIVATAGGKSCLFVLQPFTRPNFVLTGGAFVKNFYYNTSGNPGVFTPYPTTTGAAVATANTTCVLFDPTSGTAQCRVINAAGEQTGSVTPWVGATTGYSQVLLFTLNFPVAGQFSFIINHDDGMLWGMSNGATVVSGPQNAFHSVTATQSYQVIGGNNSNGPNTDNYVVNIPTAGSYNVEINYYQWVGNQNLTLTCQGNTPVPGTPISGASQPAWPAWNTSFAPNYPTVSESQGQLVWANVGPVVDFTWHALTSFHLAPGSITDSNGFTQNPYETGVTGSTPPNWSKTLNGLTIDNPNLIWINQGMILAPTSGGLSTFNGGWEYVISLVNSLTDTVSNAGPPSLATGDFLGTVGVTVSGGLPAIIDPQVDYVAIFRTLDGGSTFFLIPGTGNTFYTIPLAQYQASGYIDTTPDNGLNILLEAPTALQNTPPAQGAINLTFHLNRIFFSIGNTVYWTSGPDTPIGNGNEGVNPLNTAVFPSLTKRLVPTASGLFVFTVSDIYIIVGNGTANSPLFPIPYAPGYGLLSYNALNSNGSLIGFFSADKRFLMLDPSSGSTEYGAPIGDLLDIAIDPSSCYLTYHAAGSTDKAWYIADGSTGWFRVNPTPAPESGLTWAPFAQIIGGVEAAQSIEVSPGLHKLLLGPVGTGHILKRDLSVNSDNGAAYPAFGTIGSLVLAQPGQIAPVSFITTDAIAQGSHPSISVLMDEISGTFDTIDNPTPDPPQLEPSGTVYSDRFWLMDTNSPEDNPALCRHMQIKFSWPVEDKPNELLTMTLFGSILQED